MRSTLRAIWLLVPDPFSKPLVQCFSGCEIKGFTFQISSAYC